MHYNGAAMNLSIDDFEYELPSRLIAQHPSQARSASRLLRVGAGTIADHHFSELPDMLSPGDLLVFNDTKVIKARLFGKKETGGRIEVLIERLLSEREALAQVHAGRPAKPGGTLDLAGGLEVRVLGRVGEFYHLCFPDGATVLELLERHGSVPLPPYITHAPDAADERRYQTVYARSPGAVAAPTAGLHFDEPLLAALAQRGVEFAYVTLHVGAGTVPPKPISLSRRDSSSASSTDSSPISTCPDRPCSSSSRHSPGLKRSAAPTVTPSRSATASIPTATRCSLIKCRDEIYGSRHRRRRASGDA